MEPQNHSSFDDTMTATSIKALMFKADSFEELQDVHGGSSGAALGDNSVSPLPTSIQLAEPAAAPVQENEFCSVEAGESSEARRASDEHAARRSAMMARRQRRSKRSRRANRARGAARITMF